MCQTARLLLANEQGGPLAQLHVTPELPALCKTLGAIVIHTVAVLESSFQQPVLQPLVNMMANPAALAVSALATYVEAEDPMHGLRGVAKKCHEYMKWLSSAGVNFKLFPQHCIHL